jgi:tripartite-type tricarboxylate transporter receptor subunit TctC
MELFKFRTGTKIVHVAYRGASLAITDVVAGQIHMALGSTLAVGPHLGSGRLKALAVTSARRTAPLPNVPTLAESGLPGFDVSAWTGVVVPAGVPPPILAKLNHDIVAAARSPELRDRLAADGGEAIGSSAEAFVRHIRAEIATWAKVVKIAGVRAE